MLSRKDGGGSPCDSSSDLLAFHKDIINAFLLQLKCAQHACHASANDEYIGAFVAVHRGK